MKLKVVFELDFHSRKTDRGDRQQKLKERLATYKQPAEHTDSSECTSLTRAGHEPPLDHPQIAYTSDQSPPTSACTPLFHP